MVPETIMAAHSVADTHLHDGMRPLGSYYYLHRHMIMEDWQVGRKNAMADHIDRYHLLPQSPTGPLEATQGEDEPKVASEPTLLD